MTVWLLLFCCWFFPLFFLGWIRQIIFHQHFLIFSLVIFPLLFQNSRGNKEKAIFFPLFPLLYCIRTRLFHKTLYIYFTFSLRKSSLFFVFFVASRSQRIRWAPEKLHKQLFDFGFKFYQHDYGWLETSMQIIDIYSKNFKPHSRFNSTIYLLTGKCALSSSRSHSTAHHPANFLTFRLLRSWHNRVQSNFLLFHLFLNLFFRLETQYCPTVLIFLLKNFATFFCDS